MTTNAGAELMSRRSMGFSTQDHSSDAMEAVNRLFTPEFRNRLDAIIKFKSLDRKTVANVVDKFLIELETQLADKRVTLQVDDAARGWLAEHGFDAKMGARPMARVIQESIKRPMADELLFGKLAKGGKLKITVTDGALSFTIESLETSPEPATS